MVMRAKLARPCAALTPRRALSTIERPPAGLSGRLSNLRFPDKTPMRMSPWMAALAAAMLVVSTRPARAQLFEAVGTRAQGLGGAFVAVADDATASWWNPAGLATGAY